MIIKFLRSTHSFHYPDISKEHYLPFGELYGLPPVDKHRPSLQPTGDVDAIEADKKHKVLFNITKVHSVVHCEECFKPRCIYSSQ